MPLRKIDRYLFRQVFSAAFFAVLILSVVLVLGNLFKEINELLVERGAPISFLGIFILKFLPVSLVYTIPWGFLAAVLLVFGRLSSDQELNALRSAGLSLYRIAAPILVLGLALSLLCLWLNATISPRSKGELKTMLFESFKSDPLRLLDPGVVQSRMKGQKIYIQERNPDSSLGGFHAYQIDTKDRTAPPLGYIYARNVSPLTVDQEAKRLDLKMSGAYVEKFGATAADQRGVSIEKIEPWVLPLDEMSKQRLKPNRLDNEQIRQLLADPPPQLTQRKLNQFAFERVRRHSFSFAPLAFALVGIPLGLASRRKETSTGAGMSLVVAVVYFLFFAIADDLQEKDLFLSQLMLWLPNLLALLLGIFLFRKATLRA